MKLGYPWVSPVKKTEPTSRGDNVRVADILSPVAPLDNIQYRKGRKRVSAFHSRRAEGETSEVALALPHVGRYNQSPSLVSDLLSTGVVRGANECARNRRRVSAQSLYVKTDH